MTKKPHYNVVIATPGSSFTQGYMRSILQTTAALMNENISWTFLNQSGSLVAMAREMTIAGMGVNDINMTQPCQGNFTYDKIIWIDSDIEWAVADFFKLYKSNKDILSGCYLMQDRTVPIYTQVRGNMMSEEELLTKTDPFEVVGAGFGFISMKNGVFEKMPRPWFGPVAIPNEGNDSNPEFVLIGEDLSWCTKAIRSGFDIWVDPSVRVTHQKTFPLIWRDMLNER